MCRTESVETTVVTPSLWPCDDFALLSVQYMYIEKDASLQPITCWDSSKKHGEKVCTPMATTFCTLQDKRCLEQGRREKGGTYKRAMGKGRNFTNNEASVDLPQPLVPQSKTVTDSFLSRILQNPTLLYKHHTHQFTSRKKRLGKSSKFLAMMWSRLKLKNTWELDHQVDDFSCITELAQQVQSNNSSMCKTDKIIGEKTKWHEDHDQTIESKLNIPTGDHQVSPLLWTQILVLCQCMTDNIQKLLPAYGCSQPLLTWLWMDFKSIGVIQLLPRLWYFCKWHRTSWWRYIKLMMFSLLGW